MRMIICEDVAGPVGIIIRNIEGQSARKPMNAARLLPYLSTIQPATGPRIISGIARAAKTAPDVNAVKLNIRFK